MVHPQWAAPPVQSLRKNALLEKHVSSSLDASGGGSQYSSHAVEAIIRTPSSKADAASPTLLHRKTSSASSTSPFPSDSTAKRCVTAADFSDPNCRRIKLLGRGSSGSVYAYALADGSVIAVKEVFFPQSSSTINAIATRGAVEREISPRSSEYRALPRILLRRG